jgi:NDP-sugar pyrophosphorylase family protein
MVGMTSGRDVGRLAETLPPVCILAGGLGTRLGERVRDTPKPLLEVAGEPFLIHQLRLLAGNGAREVVMCVGYRGELIESRLGHERFGITLSYSFDAPGLDGTLGAVRRALPLLGECFLVLNGDTYLPVDYLTAAGSWRGSGLPALMTVMRNEGRWETSNAIYADGRVLAYDKRAQDREMRWIDCGLLGFERSTVERAPAAMSDLSDLTRRLADESALFGFEVEERYHEIGTPGSLRETDRYLRNRAPVPASGEGRGFSSGGERGRRADGV